MNFRFLNGNLHLVNYVLARVQEQYDLEYDIVDIRIRAKNSNGEQVELVDSEGGTPILVIQNDTLDINLNFDSYQLVKAGLTFFIKPEDNPAYQTNIMDQNKNKKKE